MKELFPHIAPVLLMLWLLGTIAGKRLTGSSKWKTVALLVSASLVIVLYPFSNRSLAEYLLSANPVFSVGTTALLFVLVIRKLFGRELLSRNDIIMFAVWNVVLGLVLYLSALGLISFDIYRLGYGSPWLFLTILMVTIALFVGKNRLGTVFLACIGAFNLGVLSSFNLFDYLTDGILFLFSCAILIAAGVKKITHPAMIYRA